jgi:hypothetical protein
MKKFPNTMGIYEWSLPSCSLFTWFEATSAISSCWWYVRGSASRYLASDVPVTTSQMSSIFSSTYEMNEDNISTHSAIQSPVVVVVATAASCLSQPGLQTLDTVSIYISTVRKCHSSSELDWILRPDSFQSLLKQGDQLRKRSRQIAFTLSMMIGYRQRRSSECPSVLFAVGGQCCSQR